MALYTKYRPQSFGEVLGQEAIISALLSASKQGLLSHAYLFTGTRGVGKTTVARLLAKTANCLHLKEGDACLNCANCKAIAEGVFMDLIEVDAASNTGVDNVREIIEHAKFQPSAGVKRVFIIDEAHMLSKQAFNALLKTLEEPPKHAMFILATTESYKLPQTIISRSQRFDFKPLQSAELQSHLAKITKLEKGKLEKDALEKISALSGGSVRDALTMLEQVLFAGISSTEDVLALLGRAGQADLEELVAIIKAKQNTKIPEFFEELTGRGVDFSVFNRELLNFLREKLVFAVKNPSSNEDIAGLVRMSRLFLKAYKDLPTSPTPDLPLLLASLEAAGLSTNSGVNHSVAAKLPDPVKIIPPKISETYSEVSLDEIKTAWPAILEELKNVNGPLATLLKNSPLDQVNSGVLYVNVKYLFHEEHLNSSKQNAIICDVINRISGKRVGFRAILNKVNLPSEEAEAMSSVLQVFGGELVE